MGLARPNRFNNLFVVRSYGPFQIGVRHTYCCCYLSFSVWKDHGTCYSTNTLGTHQGLQTWGPQLCLTRKSMVNKDFYQEHKVNEPRCGEALSLVVTLGLEPESQLLAPSPCCFSLGRHFTVILNTGEGATQSSV